MFVRTNLTSSDVLDSPNATQRRAFVEAAPSVGRLTSSKGVYTGHVLFYRPLLVGTAASALEDTATFEPLSPFAYGKKVECRRISELDPNIDYAVLQCEEIPGANRTLKAAYPSLSTNNDLSILGYSQFHSNKAVSSDFNEESLKGAIQTPLGSHKIAAVVGKDGLIPADSLHDIYDKTLWPIARLYSRKIENHYFTFFRQYEVIHDLPHKGREGIGNLTIRYQERYRRLRKWLGL